MTIPLQAPGESGRFRISWDQIVPSPEEYFGTQDDITASTTQSQGQQALTKRFNRVSVCANTNDVVTLPAARTGLMCCVRNDGAETLQIFPATGGDINGGSTNASVTLAAGSTIVLGAMDAVSWYTYGGA